MTGAESLLRTAARAGVEICFANPGTTEIALVAGLDRVPAIRAHLGLFEGVCTGAADGWARMRGGPALTLLHLGPGLANGLANLHNARRAHSPVVNLVGDHASWHRGQDPPLASDIPSLARPVSGWVRTSETAKNLGDDLAAALAAAAGPPGQVATLILPADHQEDEAPGPVAPPAPSPPPEVPADRLEGARARLAGARTPVLLLGGRALADGECLALAARVARATGARLVAETFPARWERGAGLPAVERLPYFPEQAQALLEPADLVLQVGAGEPVAFFGTRGHPGRLTREEQRQVLTEPGEDAQRALACLAEALGATESGTNAGAALPEPGRGALDPDAVGRALVRHLPPHAIVMDEAATSGLPFLLHSVGAPPHTLLTLTGGAIGQGLPCALGAALACPERRVVAFQADGSAQYTLQTLWSLAREGADVTVLLCSNRSYRILEVELARAGVLEPGPQARSLTSLSHPDLDWVSLARGYGVPAARVATAEELEEALPRAFAEPGPRLLELVL